MEKKGLCLHGMPAGYLDAVDGKAMQAFLDDLWWSTAPGTNYGRDGSISMHSLHLKHPVLNHSDTKLFLYGLAASFLSKDYTRCNAEEKTLGCDKAWKTFQAALHVDKSSSKQCPIQPSEKMTSIKWSFVKHCGSWNDAIAYLDKKVPCDCLNAPQKRVLEHHPETRSCDYCGGRTRDTQWCSECLMWEYCSEECQLAVWPLHQIECKMVRGEISIVEATIRISTAIAQMESNKYSNTNASRKRAEGIATGREKHRICPSGKQTQGENGPAS